MRYPRKWINVPFLRFTNISFLSGHNTFKSTRHDFRRLFCIDSPRHEAIEWIHRSVPYFVCTIGLHVQLSAFICLWSAVEFVYLSCLVFNQPCECHSRSGMEGAKTQIQGVLDKRVNMPNG